MKFESFYKVSMAYLACASLFGCSSASFLMTSEGESFDALSKITDSDKPSIHPNGGDNNSNLVFSSRENDGSYNIYLKDNVLSKAIIQKTSGDNFNLAPDYCNMTNQIVFQYFDKTNFDI